MKRTCRKILVALLAVLVFAAGCGSDDEDDEIPMAEYKVLGGRLVWCAGTIESITVPDNASSIGNNAFKDCAYLTKVVIPLSVTKIGTGTFFGVAVTEIEYKGDMAAWETLLAESGIAAAGFPAKITVRCADGIWKPKPAAPATGDDPKPDAPDDQDEWQITPDGVLVRYTGSAADVPIPENVTAIGGGAFAGCAGITHVTIPGGVTSIGENAFDGCTSLTGIDIPAGVTDIAPGAFGGSGITAIDYKGESSAWGEMVEASGITGELAGITVTCADGSWTPDHTHDWSETYADGGDGTHHRTCAGCGERSTAEEHAYGGTPQADGDGGHYQTCTAAGCEAQSETVPHGYTYTDNGDTHTMTCADCAHTKNEPHDWGGETYTDAGHVKACSRCGRSETARHTWSDTYTDGGTSGHYQSCTTAGCNAHSATEAHGYAYKDNADGSHYQTCTAACGYSVPVAHDWGAYEDDGNGNHSRTCTVTGTAHTETEAHTYDGYTDDKNGKHYQTCTATGCGAQSAAEAHDCKYKDNGDDTHTTTCANCDYAKTDEEHRYENGACVDCKCPRPPTVYAASTGSDNNDGTRTKPFATIQKAIDTVIAQNDGTSAYTIYVDGTLDGTTAAYIGANGMADFSALSKNLKLTIKALSGTATLDGGARFDAGGNVTNAGIGKRIIYAKSASGTLNLTLENLVITGGLVSSDFGGGIYFSGKTLEMKDCTISGCKARYGGGVYVYNASTFTIDGGTISDCTATIYGGGVYNNGTFTMSGSASIPAGDDGKNGVYLASGKPITVAGALTAATPVATITPSAYTAGTQVLTAGTGVTITQDICDKFALSEEGWQIVPKDGDNTAGVLKAE